MRRVTELAGSELEWTQPRAMKREFELRANGEVVSTLRFRSSFGSLATAECAEGIWTFKRIGFWKPRVTIRPAGSDTEIAVFANGTWSGGGTLQLADGRRLPANTNLWKTSFEFRNEREESLVRFTRIRGAFHMSCTVEIGPAGAGLAELPWLTALGWYLAVKMHDDAAAAAAGAAGAAGAG